MPFNENWRSHRQSPAPVTRAPDPAAAALGRAIMLARALRWRDEWRTEMVAWDAKANGGGKGGPPRAAKRNGDARFAAAVARKEFGRFYWDVARTEASGKKDGARAKRNGKGR